MQILLIILHSSSTIENKSLKIHSRLTCFRDFTARWATTFPSSNTLLDEAGNSTQTAAEAWTETTSYIPDAALKRKSYTLLRGKYTFILFKKN